MTTLPVRPPQPALEVRCAGCSETLEVEPGLTEFLCPDCHTPQSLPPELMPRKRKALPLPRGPDPGRIQLPCGSCAAPLIVPHGLARFGCPKCGVELAVDQEKLKGYLAGCDVAADVAVVVPCAVRLPVGLDVVVEEPASQDLRTHVSPQKRSSSSINTNKNIRTTIPSSMSPVPCRLNSHQTDVEELSAEEREETIPTSPLTKKATSKQTKQNKKQSAGPTTKELELSLRRSKRIADSSPPSKKKQKSQTPPSQSQPSQSQSQPSEETETPLDIARHYSELFPLDSEPLWNPDSPIPHPNPGSQIPDPNPGSQIPDLNPHGGDVNSDDEGADEDYVVESDSTQSEPEPDSSREPESDSVLQKALKDAHKRRGLTPGRSTKSTKSTPGKRGPSRCLDIWARPDDDPIEIAFNELGQPVGETAYALSNFLGSVSRDGKLVPLNYTDWRAVPLENKDIVWHIVKSKFRVQEENRRYVLRAVGRNWICWKSRLKKSHYDVHDNDDARLADIDERIEADQWPFLVNFWGSDEGKRRSEQNRAAQAKLKTYHTMGRKSFARLREEERLKRANKEEPCRAEMFILTHTRKDGTPIDEESAQIIARLRGELSKSPKPTSKALKDDILSRVLGKERQHIRTYGLLPARPDSLRAREGRAASEAQRLADEKMEAMERRHEQMEREMRLMREAMLAMQGNVPPGFGASLQGGNGECGGSDRERSS